MAPDNLKFLQDLSPIVAAVGVIYLIVKVFISYLERKDRQSQDALLHFDKRLEDMSKSYFDSNSQTNTIIGNHIDHATRAFEKTAETNQKLEIAVNTLVGIVGTIIKKE